MSGYNNGYGTSGTWNDLNCESFNDWLCEIRAGEVDTMCTKCLLYLINQTNLDNNSRSNVSFGDGLNVFSQSAKPPNSLH